jgi:hypothetical protein
MGRFFFFFFYISRKIHKTIDRQGESAVTAGFHLGDFYFATSAILRAPRAPEQRN